MKNIALMVCLSTAVMIAGCAMPAQQGPNQGRMQKRSAMGMMAAPSQNQPPDAPPQEQQPQK